MHEKNIWRTRKMMMLIVKQKNQKKRYISPEERQKIINELRLV